MRGTRIGRLPLARSRSLAKSEALRYCQAEGSRIAELADHEAIVARLVRQELQIIRIECIFDPAENVPVIAIPVTHAQPLMR